MRVLKQDSHVLIQAKTYQFMYDSAEPLWANLNLRKNSRLRLFLMPQINTSTMKDKVPEIVAVSLRKQGSDPVIELTFRSLCWKYKKVIWRLNDFFIETYCLLEGEWQFYIDDLTFLGTLSPDKVLSKGNFHTLFSPVPNAENYNLFKPSQIAHNPISAGGFHGGTGFFTPAPFFYAFQWHTGDNVGVGLHCHPGENNFSDFSYLGEHQGFLFRLEYDCATLSHSPARTPSLVFYCGNDPIELLKQYCDHLYEKGIAPKNAHHQPEWWHGPIFCGWGEQCSCAMKDTYNKSDGQLNTSLAREACTQKNYEQWLDYLLEKGLKPRIIIIDDGWESIPGSPIPHATRWRNLRTFIDYCHSQRIKVLLWWNCFESQMAQPNETIRTLEGIPVKGLYGAPCADPTNPNFAKRLKKILQRLLSKRQRALNADGLKIDINGSIPSGKGFLVQGNVWGTELMKAMMRLIYDTAHEIKDNALIETHTVNPYFNDVIDMIRLNDIICPKGKEIEAMTLRQKVARAASPHWLIDPDCWPLPDRESLGRYICLQPELGVPSLYYALSIGSEPTPLTDEEYALIRNVWNHPLKHRES